MTRRRHGLDFTGVVVDAGARMHFVHNRRRYATRNSPARHVSVHRGAASRAILAEPSPGAHRWHTELRGGV